jgi:hypothetical protein
MRINNDLRKFLNYIKQYVNNIYNYIKIDINLYIII